jgi:hypothetical protein
MRMLLGLAEGGVAPAFVLITGTWYTQSECVTLLDSNFLWYC